MNRKDPKFFYDRSDIIKILDRTFWRGWTFGLVLGMMFTVVVLGLHWIK